jgi:hypothetical protein
MAVWREAWPCLEIGDRNLTRYTVSDAKPF